MQQRRQRTSTTSQKGLAACNEWCRPRTAPPPSPPICFYSRVRHLDPTQNWVWMYIERGLKCVPPAVLVCHGHNCAPSGKLSSVLRGDGHGDVRCARGSGASGTRASPYAAGVAAAPHRKRPTRAQTAPRVPSRKRTAGGRGCSPARGGWSPKSWSPPSAAPRRPHPAAAVCRTPCPAAASG